jgi:glucans biosynthesis protein C
MIAQHQPFTRPNSATEPFEPGKARTHTGAVTGRLYFLDNLRWVLTALVVLHHLSITYGAEGSWYYIEKPADELATILLTFFTALNQGYFMGLFFLIAGYFTPAALDRKGMARFLKDRLLRLGVPLAIYALVINPALDAFLTVQLDPAATPSSFWQVLFTNWSRLQFAPGPLWFVETLLIFSTVYAIGARLWRRAWPDLTLTTGKLAFFAGLIAVASFATRQVIPVGVEWHHLQLAFFPQYIALFATGVWAYRNDWLPDLPRSTVRTWAVIVGVAVLALPIMMVSLGPEPDLSLVFGGWHWQAAAFALWEAFYAVGMSVTLLALFRRWFNGQNWFSHMLSASAYTVYIIHAPVIVALALAVRAVPLPGLLKFGLLATPALILCFVLAHLLVQYVPGAKRIL